MSCSDGLHHYQASPHGLELVFYRALVCVNEQKRDGQGISTASDMEIFANCLFNSRRDEIHDDISAVFRFVGYGEQTNPLTMFARDQGANQRFSELAQVTDGKSAEAYWKVNQSDFERYVKTPEQWG